jgi:hypothetical protein
MAGRSQEIGQRLRWHTPLLIGFLETSYKLYKNIAKMRKSIGIL